jgi:sterol desaturase/sphingolipid hydroxylase (fatty acid hydroxylase superfamily)
LTSWESGINSSGQERFFLKNVGLSLTAESMTSPNNAAPPLTSDVEQFVWKKASSVFNYYAGYPSNLLIVTGLYVRGFTYAPAHGVSLTGWAIALWSAMGLFLWTFLEYLLHRFAYHKGPGVFVMGHAMHHEKPRALLGVPYYVTAVIWISLYFALSFFFHPGVVAIAMGACWLGYILYCVAHHAAHHWVPKNAHLKRLRTHHLLHHHHEDKNFGMMTTFWDKVFGTSV